MNKNKNSNIQQGIDSFLKPDSKSIQNGTQNSKNLFSSSENIHLFRWYLYTRPAPEEPLELGLVDSVNQEKQVLRPWYLNIWESRGHE